VIAILGANSQLGKCFLDQTKYQTQEFYSRSLNLLEVDEIEESFHPKLYDAVINFSAFNDVEDAESNDNALVLNYHAVDKISALCSKNDIFFLHISTDYVFDGSQPSNSENQKPNPINKYGLSKFLGEQAVRQNCKKYLIIRTSWLYSHHQSPSNFLFNIKNLFESDADILYGAIDSFGSPTSAVNLADGIERVLKYLFESTIAYGTYHFSDIGNVSRFTFLKKIEDELSKLNSADRKIIREVKNSYFQLCAPRPINTSLNCSKFSKEFQYQFENWDNALIKTIKKL
jgi:dTDP-4-dehydrorhamnose reductase